MENTSQKNDPAIEFSSGFCNSDFKMKIGGTIYVVSTHFNPEGVIRQIKRCRFHQIKTGLSEHLTMG